MKLILILFAFLSIVTHTNSGIIDKAIAIQKQYKVTNDKYVVMIDYSKSILEERLYVINTKTAQIEMTSIVSHAWKSGALYASNFSNVNKSKKIKSRSLSY